MNKDFIIRQKSLYGAMQAVRRIVESGAQTPTILSHVLLQVKGDVFTITAATQQLEMNVTLACESKADLNSTMPAAKLADICQSFAADAELKFSFQEDKNMGTVTSGKNRFLLRNLSTDDFPHLDELAPKATFSLPRSAFRRLLEKTMFCIGAQDVRSYLNGLLLDVADGRVRAVGTDGNRLALAEIPLEEKLDTSVRMLLPRKTAERLLQLAEGDGEMKMEVDDAFVRVTLDNLCLMCRLFEEDYPDYEKVIPEPTKLVMLADRDAFLKILSRATAVLLEDRKFSGVNLEISEGILRLDVENREGERGEMEMAVEYKGDSMKIGFNVEFLIRALERIEGEKVRFYFTSSNSSCLILPAEEESYKYVIMPMRM